MKIAFIGFGEAARAFASTLREEGSVTFSAFDILTAQGRDKPVREAAERLGAQVCKTPAEAVESADWVFSAVTAADSLDAGRSVAKLLKPGQVFIDINSVSGGRKVETAATVTTGGAAYLDMAVMAPVHPKGHRTPVLIAGPQVVELGRRLGLMGFDLQIVGEEIGAATTIKMLRSMFVKGLEAVTVQTLLAARAAGRFDEIYASLSTSFPGLGWPAFPKYLVERVTRHGVRRAAEMRESAVTMAELGFPAGHAMGLAVAALQQEVGELGLRLDETGDLEDLYDTVLDARAGTNERKPGEFKEDAA
ncbi:MAG: NAD(P)-dependent oxidoreductase [Rhizobiaceae bacterium]|nr:NAD(P)-dependent oxidoreductase [Rhizobiaceae bacterium]